jgi:hypothetical protein
VWKPISVADFAASIKTHFSTIVFLAPFVYLLNAVAKVFKFGNDHLVAKQLAQEYHVLLREPVKFKFEIRVAIILIILT